MHMMVVSMRVPVGDASPLTSVRGFRESVESVMRHSRTTSLAFESRRSRPDADRQTQTLTRWLEAPQCDRVPDACATDRACKRTRFQVADQSMAVASRVGLGGSIFPRFAEKLEKRLTKRVIRFWGSSMRNGSPRKDKWPQSIQKRRGRNVVEEGHGHQGGDGDGGRTATGDW